MTKQQFVPLNDENAYLNSTHKVNLTGAELSTILYIMEGYLQGSDDNEDDTFTKDCDRVFAELQSVTDNYYAQQERIKEQLEWYNKEEN